MTVTVDGSVHGFCDGRQPYQVLAAAVVVVGLWEVQVVQAGAAWVGSWVVGRQVWGRLQGARASLVAASTPASTVRRDTKQLKS